MGIRQEIQAGQIVSAIKLTIHREDSRPSACVRKSIPVLPCLAAIPIARPVGQKELERANCSSPSSAGASMLDRDIRVIWRTPSSLHQSLPTTSTQHMPQIPENPDGLRF